MGDNPHLVYYFADAQTGEPNSEYLERVRERFSQWILDNCRRRYDQVWLDYHHEIALRHTSAKKNETDGAYDTPDHIPLRYIIAFVYPITATIKPFLAKGVTTLKRSTRCTTLGSSRWLCRSPCGPTRTRRKGSTSFGTRCALIRASGHLREGSAHFLGRLP